MLSTTHFLELQPCLLGLGRQRAPLLARPSAALVQPAVIVCGDAAWASGKKLWFSATRHRQDQRGSTGSSGQVSEPHGAFLVAPLLLVQPEIQRAMPMLPLMRLVRSKGNTHT